MIDYFNKIFHKILKIQFFKIYPIGSLNNKNTIPNKTNKLKIINTMFSSVVTFAADTKPNINTIKLKINNNALIICESE